ncbi:TRAP transporter 4TM/12TM fusion protein [Scopulibacillus darangshiensis]|uniref:TRAP transporter 4TM/12TM fusion protein n=1 Tax=Scopulibacillus darangshiensis TaxID=442528 RepID=A0A4V2SKY8_9BACL|nr:TRAP transporter fused permease subunit [Scopulibacillus darangshiensis]TCP21296.1 TRAP transporter 4TM/12TM fusion protein [Scopulibacillus darangshiensis]
MRTFKGKLGIAFTIWAIITLVFHIYTAYFGSYEPRVQRSIHLLLLLPLAFIVFPFRRKGKKSDKPAVFDWLLAILSMLPSLYLLLNAANLNKRIEFVNPVTMTQVILGTLVVILVIEACRRAVSFAFAIVIAFLICYIFVAPHLPGMFHSRVISFDRVIELFYLKGDEGIYGFLTGISSNTLFIFIAFAAIMLRTGVGKYLMDISIFLTGRYRGGPAKIAVLSSGLYGSISGSSVSDVYSTGSFSIPLMKKIGYSSTKAGAIEAVASAGGPLMPPIMGAGAFVMAEMTSTNYTNIIKAAILSAIIYYIGVLSTVHFEAISMNLSRSPKEWNVGFKNILKRIPYAIPFVAILYFLFTGYSPAKSAVYALVSCILVWLVMSRRQLNFKNIIDGVNYAVSGAVVIASALAGAGIIVAVLNQTGVALSLGNIILNYSFGNLGIALFLIMIVTLVLGAGIPTTPAYVITATVAAGALSYFDVPILIAHLFVFYFAILADITPPVGVTAFSAANVAESPPMKTALMTPRFALAGFIVPFVFVMKPELLFYQDTSFGMTVLTFISTGLAVIALAAVVVGTLFRKMSVTMRLAIFIAAIISLSNIAIISISGVILLLALICLEYLQYKGKSANNYANKSHVTESR